jgi:hypothetical protein
MKRILPVVIAAAALLFAGCKSKNNPAPTGNDSYLPVSAGSTWSYRDDISSASGNITLTMTGATATFGGRTYYEVKNDNKTGAGTSYYYAGDHIYTTRGAYFEPGSNVELQMGKDDQSIGYTWTTAPTDDGLLEGVTAKTINTIKEENITKTVNGHTFTNVIHTQVDLQVGSESNAVYDIYLAKGVGLIQRDAHAYGILVSSLTITGYTIK